MQRYTEVTPYKNMKEFFDECPDPYWKRIAQGLYYTGARAGESVQIKTQDILVSKDNESFLEVKLHTEKNPHAPIRYIPINMELESISKEVFVFSSPEEGLVFPYYNEAVLLNSHLRVMRKKFNEFWGVAPHYFRHCRLTHMVTEFDFNDQELVKYAGWCDSKPAKWYMSLKTSDLQKKMGGQ